MVGSEGYWPVGAFLNYQLICNMYNVLQVLLTRITQPPIRECKQIYILPSHTVTSTPNFIRGVLINLPYFDALN